MGKPPCSIDASSTCTFAVTERGNSRFPQSILNGEMAAGVGRPDRPRIKWLDGHRRALVVPVCGVVAFKMRQVAADDEAYIVGPDARDHRSDRARGSITSPTRYTRWVVSK